MLTSTVIQMMFILDQCNSIVLFLLLGLLTHDNRGQFEDQLMKPLVYLTINVMHKARSRKNTCIFYIQPELSIKAWRVLHQNWKFAIGFKGTFKF